MRRRVAVFLALVACRTPAPATSDAAAPAASASASTSASVSASASALPSASVAAPVAPDAAPSPHACDVEQAHFRLTKAVHGVDGTISLLACSDFGTAPVWETSEDPEKRAVVRVVTDSGRELDRLLLGSSSATLEQKTLRSDGRPTFLVTEDLTAGFGTYSGPATTLYDVEQAHLAPVHTTTGEGIFGGQTMHATWHLEPRGKGQDFLVARISPKFEADGGVSFETRFTRFTFTSAGWVARTRTEPGEVEFVDGADRPHYPPP